MSFLIDIGSIFSTIMFLFGMMVLIPGIAGTIVTGKVKGTPKVLRVLSVIALVLGIVMCALGTLIPILRLIAYLM